MIRYMNFKISLLSSNPISELYSGSHVYCCLTRSTTASTLLLVRLPRRRSRVKLAGLTRSILCQYFNDQVDDYLLRMAHCVRKLVSLTENTIELSSGFGCSRDWLIMFIRVVCNGFIHDVSYVNINLRLHSLADLVCFALLCINVRF